MLDQLPSEVQLELWLAAWCVDPSGRTAAALRASTSSLASLTRDRYALAALAMALPLPIRLRLSAATVSTASVASLSWTTDAAYLFMETHLLPMAPFKSPTPLRSSGHAVDHDAGKPPSPPVVLLDAQALWYLVDTVMARLAARMGPQLALAANDATPHPEVTAWRTLACRYLQACARHDHLPLSMDHARRMRTASAVSWAQPDLGPATDLARAIPPRRPSVVGLDALQFEDAPAPEAVAQALLGSDRSILSIGVLWLAASYGSTKMVRWLMAAGADVHACSDAAVRQAVALGHAAAAEVLLEAGANVHVNDEELLFRAVTLGYPSLVRLLLRYNARLVTERFTALSTAVVSGHAAVVQELLQERPLDALPLVSEALCLAVLRNNSAALELLLAFQHAHQVALSPLALRTLLF